MNVIWKVRGSERCQCHNVVNTIHAPSNAFFKVSAPIAKCYECWLLRTKCCLLSKNGCHLPGASLPRHSWNIRIFPLGKPWSRAYNSVISFIIQRSLWSKPKLQLQPWCLASSSALILLLSFLIGFPCLTKVINYFDKVPIKVSASRKLSLDNIHFI
jgi:hypothetical protein